MKHEHNGYESHCESNGLDLVNEVLQKERRLGYANSLAGLTKCLVINMVKSFQVWYDDIWVTVLQSQTAKVDNGWRAAEKLPVNDFHCCIVIEMINYYSR